ncbi:MAG: hypothetical protein JXB07_18015 [Anaerolineae bacterium]|nr:hypothetical protein [Anaerolineae bacterium]
MSIQTAVVRPSEIKRLQGMLRGWDARLRLRQSIDWLPKGLLIGLLLTFVLALAARLWPIVPQRDLIMLGILLTVLSVAGAQLGVWLWKRTPFQLARRFDVLFGLKEHISTALELGHGVLPAESQVLAHQQLDQALRLAGKVNPARYISLLPERRARAWWGGVLIALLASGLAIFLPNPQEQVLAQQAEVEQAIAQTLEELEHLREQAMADPSLTPEQQLAVVEALDEAIETLSQRDVSQEEALAALDATQQSLRDLSEQFAAEQQQALQQASGLFNGTAAQEVADALAEGDFQEAGEALQNIDPSTLTPEQQQQLAQSLQAAADALQGSDPQTAQALEDAAQALQSGDPAAAGQALDQAGQAMAQSGGKSTARVDQYADQVEKGQSSVSKAGKNPGNQPGQGGMGQAPGGQGTTNQNGQGRGSSGSGRGESNGDGGPGGQAGDQMPTDNGPGDGGERDYEDIFSPQRVGGEGGEEVDIPGDPGAGMPTGVEGDLAANPSGSSNVPYNEVWSDYEGAVNQALDSGHIPLGLRDLIKNYFGSLDPKK